MKKKEDGLGKINYVDVPDDALGISGEFTLEMDSLSTLVSGGIEE